MKRLVINENAWIELDNSAVVTKNGSLVMADSVAVGDSLSNLPLDKFVSTGGGRSIQSYSAGTVTNIATFD